MISKKISIAFVFILLGACAHKQKPHYEWGSYEVLVYGQYAKPSSATPMIQIQTLESEIENTKSKGNLIPPGLYAHLGFLNYQIGNKTKAKEYFAQEKSNYPESGVLMDRFLNK